jgi:hypothetical protein
MMNFIKNLGLQSSSLTTLRLSGSMPAGATNPTTADETDTMEFQPRVPGVLAMEVSGLIPTLAGALNWGLTGGLVGAGVGTLLALGCRYAMKRQARAQGGDTVWMSAQRR